MDLHVKGWRTLLLGAGRGLGGAAALALAKEGASVAVVARTRETVEERARLCREAGAQQAIAIGLSEAQLDGRKIHWAEGRPREQGRVVNVARDAFARCVIPVSPQGEDRDP